MIHEEFDAQTRNFLVIDGDERVVYAYLLDDQQDIISDVWICNLVDAPTTPEWEHRPPDPPFMNPIGFCDPSFRIGKDLRIHWERDDGCLKYAEILDNGKVVAKLVPGVSPGMNIAAFIDGPLANKFRPA